MLTPIEQAHHAILAVEDKPRMTITDGSTVLTSTAGNHATDVINGDIFDLSGTTADVTLANYPTISFPAADTISFIGATSINLTGGYGHDVITSVRGTNTFTTGLGNSLDVTGGIGADAYHVQAGSLGLTVEDFSAAKGDTLTVDSTFKGRAYVGSDGAGGTLIAYQNGPHHSLQIDLRDAIVSANSIHYAHLG